MARYIDADSLYRRVKTHTNPYSKPTLDYKSGVKVLDMINQEPTADVAPKSEVERWRRNLEAVLEERAEEKTEVAREIFAEIDMLIDLHKENTPTHIPFCYIDSKFVYRLDKLKKKYTEGNV